MTEQAEQFVLNGITLTITCVQILRAKILFLMTDFHEFGSHSSTTSIGCNFHVSETKSLYDRKEKKLTLF